MVILSFFCLIYTDFLDKNCFNRNVLKSNIQSYICSSSTQTYHKFYFSHHCQHFFLYSTKECVLFLFFYRLNKFIFYILINVLGFASFLVKILFLQNLVFNTVKVHGKRNIEAQQTRENIKLMRHYWSDIVTSQFLQFSVYAKV